uniref:Uncharacterized protein n=1 Tax=Timema genevievae TaxID=629358 RepID=A0A7R9K9E3_TIMGE|nr:unnamed protein product [Timema genevievae]
MLSLVIEGMLGNFEADHEFFPAYVECAVELPTKYLERMTSPSVWWEVTPHKLRQSVGIRSALARRADSEVPLVWLNECIDATATLTGEQSTVLLNIAIVMCDCRDHETNCRWALELLGQIQSVINNKTNRDSQQASLFLCDVFILSVVVLSGYNCLALSLENVSYSRETRLQLFPHALVNLLACEQWSSITNQVSWK